MGRFAAAYDFVVVGAGAAGCVVASRLAESGDNSVLLLEAGPDRRKDAPPGLRDGWGLNRDFYWTIESVPDVDGTVHTIPRCRIVGGTSWMTRFALRGSTTDFDEWVALGNPGWSFEEVLPHFNRLESDLDFGDEPWHGSGGPLPITR